MRAFLLRLRIRSGAIFTSRREGEDYSDTDGKKRCAPSGGILHGKKPRRCESAQSSPPSIASFSWFPGFLIHSLPPWADDVVLTGSTVSTNGRRTRRDSDARAALSASVAAAAGPWTSRRMRSAIFSVCREHRAHVVEVLQERFRVDVAFAAEHFVAIDRELVEEIARFVPSLLSKFRQDRLQMTPVCPEEP